MRGIFEDVGLMVTIQTALRSIQQVELPPESIYVMADTAPPTSNSIKYSSKAQMYIKEKSINISYSNRGVMLTIQPKTD